LTPDVLIVKTFGVQNGSKLLLPSTAIFEHFHGKSPFYGIGFAYDKDSIWPKEKVFGLLKKRRCNKDNPVEHWQCYLVNEILARLLHIKLIG
jgi:hypothetical protein